MILSIIAVVFAIASVIAFVIGNKYSTSEAPKNKLSVFANDSSSSTHSRTSSSSNDKSSAAKKKHEHNNHNKYAPCLSIVIPAYNEEERMPIMLDQTIKFCNETVQECKKLANVEKSREIGHFSDFEIIVVDDCSKDDTIGVFEKYKKANPDVKLSLVSVKPNRGKGFAVRSGFLAASGDYVLMADGDGATKISDVCKLLSQIRTSVLDHSGKVIVATNSNNNDSSSSHRHPFIAVGSRAHLEAEAIAKRTFLRTLLMKAFHLVVQITYFCGTRGSLCHVHDTQCGFKLFDRRLCEPMFLNNRLERFAFDVELFICANRLGLGSVEVPVNWVEVPGSKVNLKAIVQMGLDCLLMCFTYGLGFWGVQRKF